MPPAKRKKTTAEASVPAQVDVRVLLARCSRADLETLLEDSVATGHAVTYDDVKAKLPQAKQTRKLEATKVTVGQQREGTGCFDCLDDECLLHVLSMMEETATVVSAKPPSPGSTSSCPIRLRYPTPRPSQCATAQRTLLNLARPLHAQLSCCIAVCKAWRSSLRSSSVLFEQLGLTASRYGYLRGHVRVSSSNVPRLLQWLPDLAAVRTLTLDVGDKSEAIAPDVVKKALPLFNGLTSLSLGGKKMTAAVLAVVAKQPYAANLTTFELGNCGAKVNDALPLLANATRLEVCACPAHALLLGRTHAAERVHIPSPSRCLHTPNACATVATAVAQGQFRLRE